MCEYGLCSKNCICYSRKLADLPININMEWILSSNYCNLEDLRKYPYGNQIKFVTTALFTCFKWLSWYPEALCSISNTIVNVAFGKSFKHVKRMFHLAMGMPYALVWFCKVKLILKYEYVISSHIVCIACFINLTNNKRIADILELQKKRALFSFVWLRIQLNFAWKLFLMLTSSAFEKSTKTSLDILIPFCSEMSLTWNIKMLSKETGLPSQIF